MDKFAALDLGTNTFHLLIASFDTEGNLIEHFRDKRYIHLAENGIEQIGEKAYQRAIRCINDFHKHLSKYKITGINCSGTAAMRTASNGPTLVEEIKNLTGIHVNLIDGIQEAKYIYQGVRLAVQQISHGNHVIMDIGGGSVEFIIIENGHFKWSSSFPVGIAVLKRQFHKTEPITEQEKIAINHFLEKQMAKLLYQCKNTNFQSLIGASGSFEVLSEMFKPGASDQLSYNIPIDFFEATYGNIVIQDLQQRLMRDDIPNDRANLITTAFHLMKFVLDQINFQRITVSDYAMKEGMLSELSSSES